jgi:hypothetical protein
MEKRPRKWGQARQAALAPAQLVAAGTACPRHREMVVSAASLTGRSSRERA